MRQLSSDMFEIDGACQHVVVQACGSPVTYQVQL